MAETPRSIYKVAKLYEALQQYAKGSVPDPVYDEDYSNGIALARACYARKDNEEYLHILPFTPETIVKITSNPGGSPGITNYGMRKAESQVRALERGLQTLRGEKAPEPCLGIARTQFNDKTRLVWCYPYSMTAIEGLLAYPLIQHFKKAKTPMAFALPSIHLGTKLRAASYQKEWAYSLDASQFDANNPRRTIHESFKILRTWFDPNEVEPVSGKTVKEIFDIIEQYFIFTPIVMPNMHLYLGKDHGVPSGSYFTQMVDTTSNTIDLGAIASHFHLNVDKNHIFVLGDDILFWCNRKINLDVIADYARKTLRLKLHGSEKSKIYRYNEVIHFLGRDWANGLPTLAEEDIIARMAFPENFRRYDKDDVERAVKRTILSYAAVYRRGWSIAYKLLGSDSYVNCGSAGIDPDVYCYQSDWSEQTAYKHLTGLQRYRKM